MTDYEFYSLVVGAIVAVTTVIICMAAIWGEWLRQYWIRPNLKINFRVQNLNQITNGNKCWYYHIAVTNTKTLSPANNVRVLLTKVLKKSPDGFWLEQTFSGPVQVTWSLHLNRSMYATIGPEDSAVFGNLEKSARSFILQLYYYPNNLKETIEPNQPTRLVFKAVSDTAESNELTIEVEWDGVWEEDTIKMKGHCKVAEIT